MTINSRAKGKAGELELAAFFREHGIEARRGQQFSGGTDSPDIVLTGLTGYHIECKRCERGQLYDWLAQAIRDCGANLPVVFHRKSRKDWVAILRAEDFLKLVNELEELRVEVHQLEERMEAMRYEDDGGY